MEANEKKKGLHYGFVILACCICFYSIVVGVTCNTNMACSSRLLCERSGSYKNSGILLPDDILYCSLRLTQPFAGSIMSKYPVSVRLRLSEP